MTSAEARAQRSTELARRSAQEHACALDYRVYGDGDDTPASVLGLPVTRVTHAERCVFGPADACSRKYDPLPYAEAEPIDLKLYEGTAIGALYGICADTVTRTWNDGEGGTVTVTRPLLELQGWSLAPHTSHG